MLHILTAVTRPNNLPVMARSLTGQWRDLTWHLRHDREHAHVGGQRPKNVMLDEVRDGWVWVLDDDTLAHPGLFTALQPHFDDPDVDAVVVSQLRRDGSVLHAAPGNVMPNFIDIGQAVIRRERIGDERIPETYDGDGIFLTRLLPCLHVAYIDRVLSFHNALQR